MTVYQQAGTQHSPDQRLNSASFTLTYCLSCLVRPEKLINCPTSLIHLNKMFRECEIIKERQIISSPVWQFNPYKRSGSNAMLYMATEALS